MIRDHNHIGIGSSVRGGLNLAEWLWLHEHAGVNLLGQTGRVWNSCVSCCEL